MKYLNGCYLKIYQKDRLGELTPSALYLFISFCSNEKLCHLSSVDLAKEIGFSIMTVIENLKQLKTNGFIERSKKFPHTMRQDNQYQIVKKNPFMLVPNKNHFDLISDKRRKRYLAIILFICICIYKDNKTGECYPGIKKLAETMNCSISTIYRSLQELETKGFVKRNKKCIQVLSLDGFKPKITMIDPIREVKDTPEDKKIPEEKVDYKGVFELFNPIYVKILKEPSYPLEWIKFRNQREAVESLLEKRGKESIKKVINFYCENVDKWKERGTSYPTNMKTPVTLYKTWDWLSDLRDKKLDEEEWWECYVK